MSKRIIIVGAGVAGKKLLREIRKDAPAEITIVGFVDDDVRKKGGIVGGVRVLGSVEQLPQILKRRAVDEVVISAPSVGAPLVARVTELLPHRVPVKVLPSISSVIMGDVNLSDVRDIDLSDLMGRPLVKIDQKAIGQKSKGKRFLVTGAAGSIGSEIVRQLRISQAASITAVDAWEEGVFNLGEELKAERKRSAPETKLFVGNVRDKKRMAEIVAAAKADVIIHAAAYKHVPLMEQNPTEARKTNYGGTKNMLEVAVAHKVKDFVLISTDKAVNPANVMGKTKRDAEKLVLAYAKKYPNHRFCAVRFGNVFNSSGSVVPIFLRQIRERTAVTITHKEVTRYFMSIPEAVSLVLSAWIASKNGQILLLDMGEPIKILDLAITLIRLQGLEPYTDIAIREIGMRPGDKMYEELSYDRDKIKRSPVDRVFIAEDIDD